MANQTLVKANGGAIAAFGSRDEVRELTERLKIVLPGGGVNLNRNQIIALAQASVAHGLDPMNGELYILVDRDGKSHGLMIGIKGLRKKAREQITANGRTGNFWCDFPEITDLEQRARYGVGEKDLAFECRLYDSDNIRTYVEATERLLKAGIPWEAVERMVGSRPYTTGIGILKAADKTKMERVQCAMKRAESDALKRRFDVPLGMAVADDDEPQFSGPWIEGRSESADSTEAPPETPAETTAEQTPEETAAWEASRKAVEHEQAQRGQTLLFGQP